MPLWKYTQLPISLVYPAQIETTDNEGTATNLGALFYLNTNLVGTSFFPLRLQTHLREIVDMPLLYLNTHAGESFYARLRLSTTDLIEKVDTRLYLSATPVYQPPFGSVFTRLSSCISGEVL